MFTNVRLVEFTNKALRENWGYCLGAFGNVLTPTFYNQKLVQGNGVGTYNTKHTSYLQGFMNKRVSDCYGLVKAFLWWNGGAVKYNGSQDRSANMAYNAAKEKGFLNNIPEIPGLVLWMNGHAGIYIGNGEFIECAGAPRGMSKGKIVNGRVVSGSKFTHWFKDTNITYVAVASPEPPVIIPPPPGSGTDGSIIKIKVRGKAFSAKGMFKANTNYILIDGRYVAVREIGQKLGLDVSWDAATRTVMFE